MYAYFFPFSRLFFSFCFFLRSVLWSPLPISPTSSQVRVANSQAQLGLRSYAREGLLTAPAPPLDAASAAPLPASQTVAATSPGGLLGLAQGCRWPSAGSALQNPGHDSRSEVTNDSTHLFPRSPWRVADTFLSGRAPSLSYSVFQQIT